MLFPEPLTSASKPSVLLKSVAERSSEKSDEGGCSGETINDIHVDSSEEESVTQKTEDIQTVSHLELLEETEDNDDVSIPISDISSRMETGDRTVNEIGLQDAPVDEAEVPACETPTVQEHSNGIDNNASDVSASMNATSTTSLETTVTVADTSAVTSTDDVTTRATTPITTVALTVTTESIAGETEKEVSDTKQDISGSTVASPLGDNARNASLSTKCRIPVRLGEPICLKSSIQEVDVLHNKPSTCTQDKPSIGNSVFAPTYQQLGCNSPTSVTPVSLKYVTPKSPTSVSRPGTKIPSLLPSVSHGLGKADVTSQSQNSAPSLSEKVSSPDSKLPSPSALLNHGRCDVSASSVLANSWSSSVSETDSMSDSVSGTRIPQPGFYSNSPFSLQSSKRGSLSSQSSCGSRPGSIAPLLNTSLDSSTSPVIKESGYNYINKPRFSATDHNLNISSKIPTATSLPSSHLSPLTGFSGLEDTSSYGNSKSTLSNEQSPLVSKIPTLTSTPTSTSPSSARLGSVPQRLFSTPAAESSQRTSSESPGKQTKTWMFGPHKNATVVSANSAFKLFLYYCKMGDAFCNMNINAKYNCRFCKVWWHLFYFSN
jgi:hypothetical protein